MLHNPLRIGGIDSFVFKFIYSVINLFTDLVIHSLKHFADKGLYSPGYGFSSSHVWI